MPGKKAAAKARKSQKRQREGATPRYRWSGGRRLSIAQVEQLWRRYQRLKCWRRKAAIRDADLEITIEDQPGTSGVVYTHERSRKIYVDLHVGRDESEARTAILHEMAHIDSPKDIHGKTWRHRFVEAAEEAHGPLVGGNTVDQLDAEFADIFVHETIKEQLKKRERARLLRRARDAAKQEARS